jgi:hypothetical protein
LRDRMLEPVSGYRQIINRARQHGIKPAKETKK